MNGSGLTGTGNSSANTLVTLGANTLVGGDGNDIFVFFTGSAPTARPGCRLQPKRGRCPAGVQRLRHRGAGRDLQPDRQHRPVADPFRPRYPQRDDHVLKITPRPMPGISSSCEARQQLGKSQRAHPVAREPSSCGIITAAGQRGCGQISLIKCSGVVSYRMIKSLGNCCLACNRMEPIVHNIPSEAAAPSENAGMTGRWAR